MLVRCKHKHIEDLPPKLRKFFFRQDSETGEMDLTVGKDYIVYGIREGDLGSFYLVMDDIRGLPWWMPSQLYEVVDDSRPQTWKRDVVKGEFGKETYFAPSVYYGHELDIEDSTKVGKQIFKKMQEDS